MDPHGGGMPYNPYAQPQMDYPGGPADPSYGGGMSGGYGGGGGGGGDGGGAVNNPYAGANAAVASASNPYAGANDAAMAAMTSNPYAGAGDPGGGGNPYAGGGPGGGPGGMGLGGGAGGAGGGGGGGPGDPSNPYSAAEGAGWQEIECVSDSAAGVPVPCTAVAFDVNEELVWAGFGDGQLSSFTVPDLLKYVSVPATSRHLPVLQLRTSSMGVVSVCEDEVRVFGVGGTCRQTMKAKDMDDAIQSLKLSSGASSFSSSSSSSASGVPGAASNPYSVPRPGIGGVGGSNSAGKLCCAVLDDRSRTQEASAYVMVQRAG